MDDHLYEGEKTYHQQHEEMSANGKRWEQPPILDEAKAQKAGLGICFYQNQNTVMV